MGLNLAQCRLLRSGLQLHRARRQSLCLDLTPSPLYTPSISSRSVSAAISRMALAAVYSSDS